MILCSYIKLCFLFTQRAHLVLIRQKLFVYYADLPLFLLFLILLLNRGFMVEPYILIDVFISIFIYTDIITYIHMYIYLCTYGSAVATIQLNC